MTISRERPVRYRRERIKRRKFLTRTYITVLTLSIVAIVMVGMSVMYLYNKTKTWSNSQEHRQLATLAPEYVTNFPDPDLVELSDWSGKVGDAIHQIETNNHKPEGVEQLLTDVNKFVKEKKIKQGTLLDDIKRLQLYVDYYNAVDTAITNPNMEKFKSVYLSLQDNIIKSNRNFDKTLLNNMNSIIEKYDQLNNIVTNEIPKYGTISNDKFTVYNSITDLSPLFNTLKQVSEFPQIKNFINVLEKNASTVTKNNKELALKNSHDEIIKLVNKLNGLYVQRSSIKTYKDVIKNGWKVDGNYKNSDKVVEMRYNGTKINDSDWIRLDITPEIIMEKPTVVDTQTNERQQSISESSTTSTTETTSESTRSRIEG